MVPTIISITMTSLPMPMSQAQGLVKTVTCHVTSIMLFWRHRSWQGLSQAWLQPSTRNFSKWDNNLHWSTAITQYNTNIICAVPRLATPIFVTSALQKLILFIFRSLTLLLARRTSVPRRRCCDGPRRPPTSIPASTSRTSPSHGGTVSLSMPSSTETGQNESCTNPFFLSKHLK